MSIQITDHFVRQFVAGITILAQQRMSRLMRAVRVEQGVQGSRVHLDQLGEVVASPAPARHADTPLVDTPHARRMITLQAFKHADLIDVADRIRVLNDPTNDYTRVFAAAFGRAIDDEIIDNAFVASPTGENGAGTAAFPVATHRIVNAGIGLTVPKLMEAKRILDSFENDADQGGYFIAVGARQIEDLMTDVSLVANTLIASSSDFGEVKSLVRGEINFFGGFNFIRSERLNLVGTTRSCIAWAKNSLGLAIGENPNGRITERPDKNYSTQVFYSMDIGSSRLDELGVVEVECTE